MRILIAIGVPHLQEAGAAGVVLNHARELTKRGHSVDCWFLEDVLPKPTRLERFEALRFAASVARRILREPGKYDVVNIHAPWGFFYGAWRRFFHLASAPPYVMTMHGSEERYVQMMRLEDRKGRASNFGWKNRIWHRLYHQPMYDYSVKTATYGAVVNREGWLGAEIKHHRAPGRIWFVPNGVEDRFFVSRTYADHAPPRLLYVGTWLDRKGVHYLTEAFQGLVKRIPGIRLTVVGCLIPETQVKESFAPEVRDSIAVTQFAKREDMTKIYAEHDIFVLPSLVEGMPLTLLEAMATGMPVVTTESGGMADVVENEVNGFLVPAADAKSLAEAIERFCRSAELREQLGSAAREKMRSYTWEKVTQRFEKVLTLAAVNGRVE